MVSSLFTPKGKLLFVKINGHEGSYKGTPTGKYEATLEVSKEDWDEFRSVLEGIWMASEEYESVKDEVDVMNPSYGMKKRKDDKGEMHYTIQAKTSRRRKMKDGSEMEVTIPIKDGHVQDMPDDTYIMNGSIGRLMVYPKPRKISNANYGITLYLQEIQVTNLNRGSRVEFPVDDDCDCDTNVMDEEIPF